MASAPSLFLLAAILFHSLTLSTSAARNPESPSTKLINAVCTRVRDQAYCRKTLAVYPPAAAAKDLIPLAEAVIGLGRSYAEKTVAFITHSAARDPAVKQPFGQCADYYKHIVASFAGAGGSELRESPDSSNYDIMVTMDDTRMVVDTIGKAMDAASKALMKRNRQMNAYIDLAAGATDAVWDDYEHHH